MAPLNPNNTARAFLTYNVVGHDHTMMARYDPASADLATVIEQMSAFLDAIDPMVYPSTFVRFETSAEGSNVRVPQTWTGITSWGAGTPDPDEAPFFYSFTGKDPVGRRFRIEVFGAPGTQGAPWRYPAGALTGVDAAIAVLETEEAVFLSITGSTPFFNQYANRKASDHWVDELRG